MNKYDKTTLAGLIGLSLSLCLWLMSSWRLIFHTLVWKRGRQEDSDEETQQRHSRRTSVQTQFSFAQWFTRRRTFHGLLWMAMSCEALAYADISGKLSVSKDRVFAEKLGFVLLDVAGRSILELLAFCTVTAIWLKTAIESSPSVLWGSQTSAFGILPALFVVLILLLVLTSATLSVIALVVYQKDTLDTIQEHPWGRARTMLEAIAWGVHGLVVLECLFVTSQRVLNCVPAAQLSQRLSLLRKAVLPMLVASLVYLVRSFWLLAVFWHTNAIDRGTWAWWIGFAWLPTWLAVGFLLYSARKRDQLPSSEEIEQPLLLPARPPAEAFLAFSQHRQGLDIDDSFSFCRSPITHVVAHPDDLEVADEETLSAGSGAAAANQI